MTSENLPTGTLLDQMIGVIFVAPDVVSSLWLSFRYYIQAGLTPSPRYVSKQPLGQCMCSQREGITTCDNYSTILVLRLERTPCGLSMASNKPHVRQQDAITLPLGTTTQPSPIPYIHSTLLFPS